MVKLKQRIGDLLLLHVLGPKTNTCVQGGCPTSPGDGWKGKGRAVTAEHSHSHILRLVCIASMFLSVLFHSGIHTSSESYNETQ